MAAGMASCRWWQLHNDLLPSPSIMSCLCVVVASSGASSICQGLVPILWETKPEQELRECLQRVPFIPRLILQRPGRHNPVWVGLQVTYGKGWAQLGSLTEHTHLSLSHPTIMPAPIYKTIPLLPATLTVYLRLSSFITEIAILVFPPSVMWLSSVVFLCCPITQIQQLAPAATAFSLGKTRTNMKAICWENSIAGRKVPSSRKGQGTRCVTDLALFVD